MNTNEIKSHNRTNLGHTVLLLLSMAGLLGMLGWLIAGAAGIKAALIFSGAALLFTPTTPVHLIMNAYGARPLYPGSLPQLQALTRALAKQAELEKMPVLYYLPSRIPNAFAAGTRKDCAICITDGLLNTLDTREMAGIIGHEITHIKNNDMQVMWIANLFSRMTGYGSLVGQVLILLLLPIALIQGISLPFSALLLLIFSPTLSFLLNLALSRTREFQADLGSAVLTGNAHYLASALNTLERYKTTQWRHFFMAGPAGQQADFLSTHPSTEERVKRLLSLSTAYMPSAHPATPGPRHTATRFSGNFR